MTTERDRETAYREWQNSTDTSEGGAYIVDRYGDGAPGNPVFSYDRATVEAFCAEARAEGRREGLEEAESAAKEMAWAAHMEGRIYGAQHGVQGMSREANVRFSEWCDAKWRRSLLPDNGGRGE